MRPRARGASEGRKASSTWTLAQAASRFDHRNINEVEPFSDGGRNPTAEELARFFAEELGKRFDDGRVRISKVEVFETENNRAEYSP